MNAKVKYIIVYDCEGPFLSIPTLDDRINIKKIIKDYNLNKNVVIKVEKKDKFIGW